MESNAWKALEGAARGEVPDRDGDSGPGDAPRAGREQSPDFSAQRAPSGPSARSPRGLAQRRRRGREGSVPAPGAPELCGTPARLRAPRPAPPLKAELRGRGDSSAEAERMGGRGPQNKRGGRESSFCASVKQRSARRVLSLREGPLGIKCFTRGFDPLPNQKRRGLCLPLLQTAGCHASAVPRDQGEGSRPGNRAARRAVPCSHPSLPFLWGTSALSCPVSGRQVSAQWRRGSAFSGLKASRGSLPRWALNGRPLRGAVPLPSWSH